MRRRSRDHVDAKVVDNNGETITAKLEKRTGYTSKVIVFIESTLVMNRAIGEHALLDHRKVLIEPASEYTLTIHK